MAGPMFQALRRAHAYHRRQKRRGLRFTQPPTGFKITPADSAGARSDRSSTPPTSRPDDVALLDHYMAVGELQQRVDMFIDQQNGLAPAFSRLRLVQISLRMSGAKPSVASSRMSSFGLVIRLLPIASICCSPPES